MSSKTLKLKIVTPERQILEEDVISVTLPTTEGQITILADHVPLITSLGSGEILAKGQNDDIPMAVTGGFAEIKQSENGSEVIVLADFAEHISEIENSIENARTRAEELMQKKNKSEVDFEHFEAELERSLNRVKVADKWRGKKYRKLNLK